MLGLLSMLGKNLLHAVLPCLLVSDALYVYRCMDTRRGLRHLQHFAFCYPVFHSHLGRVGDMGHSECADQCMILRTKLGRKWR